ncbi:TPA: carbohydrate ABC transporter permease [Candidatus Scatenecus faecavium]|uniref:Carbohydrate ABC transporter permease n=1 Tax=Candidatus Scatenecus faecavium TaxID=2840915 RepID=A0A9D1FWR2_9BACT|nr:carbohydrate ABC transporter permease [Candidatus Scatenecus faecavium]
MRKFRTFLGYVMLIGIAISMLYPFIEMVNLSFADENAIFNQTSKLFYGNLTLENYKNVFTQIPLSRYFLNSLIVASITTVGQVIFAALAGYAFARLKFKFKNALFLIILITMLVPPQVNIIPLFFLMREMHLINSYSALILPGLFGGFGIFLMRQYFLGLPKDLEESAKIDGCNLFETFFKIALPLALPTVATLALFTFVTTWNSFMWPLIVTNTESMRTLPVGLAIFKGSFREITLWGELLACSVICTIPVIGVFLIGKKYFINDIMQGGVKE